MEKLSQESLGVTLKMIFVKLNERRLGSLSPRLQLREINHKLILRTFRTEWLDHMEVIDS